MFCYKCGKSANEDSAYCTHCGTKLATKIPSESDEAGERLESENTSRANIRERNNRRNFWIGVGVVIAVLVIGIVLFRHNTPRGIQGEWVCQDRFWFSGYGYDSGCVMKITDNAIVLYDTTDFQEGTYHTMDGTLTIKVEGHWGGRDSYNYVLIGNDWLKLTKDIHVDDIHVTEEYLFKRKK